MKPFTFLSFLLLLLSANASPATANNSPRDGCLDRNDFNRLLKYYVRFFENMTDPNTLDFANKNIAHDFQLFSDSTNGFVGIPYGAPTTDGRETFIAALSAAAVDGNQYTVLTSSYGCTTFHYRWRLTSVHPDAATGIDYVEVERGSHMYKKAYSEYNVRAIITDNGFTFCPAP